MAAIVGPEWNTKFFLSHLTLAELIKKLALIVPLLVIGAIIRMKVLYGGYKFDHNAGTLEFPGGGIAANDIKDYFRIRNDLSGLLLQSFRRFKIKASEIRSLHKYNRSGGKKTPPYRALTINGNFGAIVLRFSTLEKMEEVHSAIVVLNRMGSPIVRMR